VRRRVLGTSGLELTVIGLGTWAIGGPDWQYGWGPQTDQDSIATIHRALDLGINWIDTAAAYGLGRSEEVVGKAVKGRRDKVILATKCSLTWDPGQRVIINNLKAASVRAEIEASLRRLSTDHIDLYQIHWPDPEPDIEEGWEEISRAVKAGKIRFAGVSNFNVAQMKRIAKIHPIASLQPPYSMLRRDVEQEILPFCKANGIGVICYSPMQMGILTGGFTRERAAALPKNDQRSRNPNYSEPALSANLELVEKLGPIAVRHGAVAAAAASGGAVGGLAIAWVLRRPELTAAIVGARRPPQIEELLGAADWDLSSQELSEIDALLAAREARLREATGPAAAGGAPRP
jgi:aryl-alcohol dehydrogenase-like predicted oxidoreductase